MDEKIIFLIIFICFHNIFKIQNMPKGSNSATISNMNKYAAAQEGKQFY